METKTCNPMKTLTYSVETTFMEMVKLVGTEARKLSLEALKHEMEITGPVYWIYYGADGNPNTRFKLEICLPVFTPNAYRGNYELRSLQAFKCVTHVHNGLWNEMGPAYQRIHEYIHEYGSSPNGICREVYINVDFENPQYNVTEIQVGIN
jgi:effector-binding domain-containing protein